MIMEKFKRMVCWCHSFKLSTTIYSMSNKRVYENEKIINNYFLIKVLLKSIFSTYILSVFYLETEHPLNDIGRRGNALRFFSIIAADNGLDLFIKNHKFMRAA